MRRGKKGVTLELIMVDILKKAGRELHYRSIVSEVRRRKPRVEGELSVGVVAACLSISPKFEKKGQGFWVLCDENNVKSVS